MLPLKAQIKAWLRQIGIEVHRYSPIGSSNALISNLLRKKEIDLVIDVGANIGQYGCWLQEIGFSGNIVSFEPSSEAHAKLCERTKNSKWVVARRCALGERDGDAMINISGNSVSSSLLAMRPTHLLAAPESRYQHEEAVALHTIDTVANEYWTSINRLHLKIDAQGYERHVLQGAAKTLSQVHTMQVELSLVSMYEDDYVVEDAIRHMRSIGFSPWALLPVFQEKLTGRHLQVDGVFVRD